MEHISRTEGNHWESRSTHCCAEIRSRGCCCRYVFTTGVFPYVPMWEGNYRMLSELIESKDLAVGVLRVRGWGGFIVWLSVVVYLCVLCVKVSLGWGGAVLGVGGVGVGGGGGGVFFVGCLVVVVSLGVLGGSFFLGGGGAGGGGGGLSC